MTTYSPKAFADVLREDEIHELETARNMYGVGRLTDITYRLAKEVRTLREARAARVLDEKEIEMLQELEGKANAEIGRLTRGMQWTKTPPTQPGWYWACQKDNRPRGEVVRIFPVPGGTLDVNVLGDDGNWMIEDFSLWAGPIEAPPLPEDLE